MAIKEGEVGEFDLLGRKFTVFHGVNYTQVFEDGDAHELLHFQGKRLTIEEATIATFGWLRGFESGERSGAAKLQHQFAKLLGLATQAEATRIEERLDQHAAQAHGAA